MNVLKSSAIYSFFTFLSRIFGFLRDILIANFLGAGFLADIFFVAFRFPNTFRRIFSEGALNSAFVPIYSKLLLGTEKFESGKFAGNIISILALSTLLIVILVEIFMPYFLHLIAPGFIESPMTNKLNENQKNKIMEKIPMKKFGSPDDIANLALFLSSHLSSYITGQTFHVNGGMLML